MVQTINEKEKPLVVSGAEPNIPPEGLISASKEQEKAGDAILKKWRQIILAVIKSKDPCAKKPEQTSSNQPPNQNLSVEAAKNKQPLSEKPKKFRLKIIALVILVVLTIIASLSFLVYNAENQLTKKIIIIIPYPAAIIKTPCGWKSSSLSNFNFDVEAISFFYDQKKSSDPDFVVPPKEQITNDVFEKELKNKLMECLAKEKNVPITELELETELEKTVTQAGSEETLKNIVKNLYNWDLETFKQKVLYYYILEQNLKNTIINDQNINAENLAKIQEIRDKLLENPGNFYYLARNHSQDEESKHRGGDLNWIEKGQLDSNMETAAFTLEKGQISDIITSPAGYHLIQVTDKKTTRDGVEQVRISHLLIKSRDFNNWLDQEFKKCKIYKFI